MTQSTAMLAFARRTLLVRLEAAVPPPDQPFALPATAAPPGGAPRAAGPR